MTVSTTDNIESYTGNDVLTVFPITYPVFDETHVEVYLDGAIQGSGYTINLNADQEATPGGDCTFDVAPVLDVAVVLLRVVPYTQLVDYQPYGSFPAETHETALDKLTMQVQQLQEQLDRVDLPPPGLPDSSIFPVGAHMIGFNPNGILAGTWTQLPEGTFIMNTVAGADTAGGSNDASVVTHTHSIDHNHPASPSNAAGAHTHSIPLDSSASGNPPTETAGGTGGGVNGTDNTDSAGIHTHTVDLPNYEGTSGSAGSSGTGKNRPLYKGVEVWERTA